MEDGQDIIYLIEILPTISDEILQLKRIIDKHIESHLPEKKKKIFLLKANYLAVLIYVYIDTYIF